MQQPPIITILQQQRNAAMDALANSEAEVLELRARVKQLETEHAQPPEGAKEHAD